MSLLRAYRIDCRVDKGLSDEIEGLAAILKPLRRMVEPGYTDVTDDGPFAMSRSVPTRVTLEGIREVPPEQIGRLRRVFITWDMKLGMGSAEYLVMGEAGIDKRG